MSEPSRDDDLAAIRDAVGRDWGEVTSVAADGEFLVIRMRIDGDERDFGVRLAAPWSDMLQPWLYAPPDDTTDWASQLGTWLQEEIDTGAAHWAELTERNGVHWFTAEPYGFRPRDEAEHARRHALAPLGWNGPYRTPAGEQRWLGDTESPDPGSVPAADIERIASRPADVRRDTVQFVGTRRQYTLYAIGWLAVLAAGVLLCTLNVSELLGEDGDGWDVAQLIAAVALVVFLLPRGFGVLRGLLATRRLPRRGQRPAASRDSET